MDKKTCLQCGLTFVGRTGKRFCMDQCRALYNNNTRSKEERLIGSVNKVLQKIRRILRAINPSGMFVVKKEVLTELGFNFHCFTSMFQIKEGSPYHLCCPMEGLQLYTAIMRIVEYQSYMEKR
jgi:hypothetical protein